MHSYKINFDVFKRTGYQLLAGWTLYTRVAQYRTSDSVSKRCDIPTPARSKNLKTESEHCIVLVHATSWI